MVLAMIARLAHALTAVLARRYRAGRGSDDKHCTVHELAVRLADRAVPYGRAMTEQLAHALAARLAGRRKGETEGEGGGAIGGGEGAGHPLREKLCNGQPQSRGAAARLHRVESVE